MQVRMQWYAWAVKCVCQYEQKAETARSATVAQHTADEQMHTTAAQFKDKAVTCRLEYASYV